MADIINIIPLSNIDIGSLEFLQINLKKVFHRETRILYRISLPGDSFDRDRDQYNAEKILNYLTRKLSLKNIQDISLGILDTDIFVPRLNFIFGLAEDFPRICLISTARLNPLFYAGPAIVSRGEKRSLFLSEEDKKVFGKRILKEAVHEIGHTLGLSHCADNKCVMYFSNSLLDTDKKSCNFCPNCLKILKKTTHFI